MSRQHLAIAFDGAVLSGSWLGGVRASQTSLETRTEKKTGVRENEEFACKSRGEAL